MQRITLCVIAKNEEAMLGACLASVRGLADAIVVVDTGSTDRTAEIAREHGAEVVSHAWNDDFAAARNAALARVASGFVLVLDADERLGPGAKSAVRRAVKRDDFDCGLLPLHNANSLDAQPTDVVAGRARRGDPVALPRLLRRTPDLAWEGIVHEQVAAWALKHRRIAHVDAPIVHFGAVPSLREARAKDERNLRLLRRRCEIEPDNPTPRAYLARELERSGDLDGALREARACWSALQRSAGAGRPHHDSILPATLLGFLLIRSSEFEGAVGVLLEAQRWGDAHPNLDLLLGWAREQLALRADTLERFAELLQMAGDSFERCLRQHGRAFAAEVLPGATSFVGRTRLGTVRLLAGDAAGARAEFERALRDQPGHVEAQLGLVETSLEESRPDAALRELQSCLSSQTPDAWLLGAACAHALSDDEDALVFLDRAARVLETTPWVAQHREGRRMELETALRPSLILRATPRAAEVRTASVVIPAYNRLDLLRPVLEAFAREAVQEPFELLVVDDGSQPPVAELARSLALPASFRCIARAQNGGRGAALNTGVGAATGDVVIFCDSDIVPTPGFVAQHLRFHRERADELATCLGALDWGVDAGLFGAWSGARSNPRLRGGTRDVPWTQWFTDNYSFRRALFAKNGLRFDESYRAWGFEELDLARELVRLGATNTLVESARGLHLKPATTAGLLHNFARSVPNLLRLASKAPGDPDIAAWMCCRVRNATVLDRCEGVFERLWERCEAHARRDPSLRERWTAPVARLAIAMNDAVFRIGLARGFLGNVGAPEAAKDADEAFVLSIADGAAALLAFERDRAPLDEPDWLPECLRALAVDTLPLERLRGRIEAGLAAAAA